MDNNEQQPKRSGKKSARKKFTKPNEEKKSEEQLLKGKIYDNQDLLLMFNIVGKTLRSWRNTGTLRYVKIKAKYYYPEVFVEEMLQKHKRGGK
jgi:hypothetical protein